MDLEGLDNPVFGNANNEYEMSTKGEKRFQFWGENHLVYYFGEYQIYQH